MAVYRFKDLYNDSMYETAQVMVVTGPYSIFSNIVCDRLRDMCRGTITLDDGGEAIFDEFGLDHESSGDKSNAIPLDMFFDVARTPPLSGKWYCRVDWKELTKKQRTKLESYIKKPSEYGCLVVTASEFADYKSMLRSRALTGSAVAHIIQLSFPDRKTLSLVIKNVLKGYGARATDKAIETFIFRMSNAYDEYQERLESIAHDYGYHVITHVDMGDALKGVENYVLDDFVRRLTVPVTSTKLVSGRKIVGMLRVMLDEYGAVDLVKKLRYKITDCIQMRLLINEGIVPVRVKYSVEEAKRKLEEDNKLKGLSDYSFRKLAWLASQTSLRDWLFMRLILSTPREAYGDAEYERALYALINRGAFSENRLYNIIGVEDNLEIQPELYLARYGLQLQEERSKGKEKVTNSKTKSSSTNKANSKKKSEAKSGGLEGQALWERDGVQLLAIVKLLNEGSVGQL